MAIAIPIAVVVTVPTTALARLFELVSALRRLAAMIAVAADLPVKVRLGLAHALSTIVVPVARLRGGGTAKEHKPAQRRREQYRLPKPRFTQHVYLPSNGGPDFRPGRVRPHCPTNTDGRGTPGVVPKQNNASHSLRATLGRQPVCSPAVLLAERLLMPSPGFFSAW